MATDPLQSLASLQIELFNSIRLNKNSTSMLDMVKDTGNLGPIERLRIYQAAYRIRIKESFEEDFTHLLEHIEAREFDKLVEKYLDTSSSVYYNIAELSGDFAEFIGEERPEYYKWAIIDWLEIRSLHADTAEGVPLSKDSNNENIFLSVSPTTFIKQVNDSYILVYRKLRQLNVSEIEPKQFSLLVFLGQARSVNDIAEFAEINGFNEIELEELIKDWISENVILNK